MKEVQRQKATGIGLVAKCIGAKPLQFSRLFSHDHKMVALAQDFS